MGRIIMAIGLTILFLGWIIYRLVKGDLMQHKSTLTIGCVFVAIWVILYFTLFT